MMVKNLKIFGLIKTHNKLFDDLRFEISDYFQACPENTPEGYNVLAYGAPYLIVLSDLSMLNYEVLLYKDHLVLNVDKTYVLYNSNSEGLFFSNSSELLHSLLLKLHKGGSFIPEIIENLPVTRTFHFGNFGKKLLHYGLSLIAVIDEIILLLSYGHDVIFFSHPFIKRRSIYSSILYESPCLISDFESIGSVNNSRELWLCIIISDVSFNKNFMHLFRAIITQDYPEFTKRYGIDDTGSYKEVTNFVLQGALFYVDKKTLEFLGLNNLGHFGSMQKDSPQNYLLYRQHYPGSDGYNFF